jgi:phage terminase small subunit
MAVRGKKPRPSHLKAVEGTARASRTPENEPEFTAGELVPPDWINDTPLRVDFLREWERITRQLRDWGTLAEVNQGAVEGICMSYAKMVRAAKLGDDAESRQSFDGYRKALNEFGLTPASKGRSGSGGGKKAKDPADEFFKAG